ncbi:hypothetical protein HMPREF1138_0009 [Actinomyces sp. ICM58]|uniref:hypothetical protein n=1 Tax=Actinomyces sp. ICM58 TaxID=1105030 RepID=UPI000277187A|nr:hypothetical protein [Actinomyces sp. ICM58]EJN51452.1 hypothetical protein HMPREF1138_0009 [Actinomyces sp. ICM58]
MSAAPAPLRAATVAGAILAVIFIILSAVVGGINVWRTHSAAGYDEQAAQAQSDKAALDKQITEAKTRLDAANVQREAKEWCNSVTRESSSSIRDAIKSYDSATQAVKDTIHTECAEKETLANAQRTLSDADFAIAIGECTTDKVTTTVTGTLTVKSSSAVNSLGPLDVTIVGYTLEKNTAFNSSTPYQATTNTTLTPGAPSTFTISVPYDPNMSDKTECGASMVSWWPSNM